MASAAFETLSLAGLPHRPLGSFRGWHVVGIGYDLERYLTHTHRALNQQIVAMLGQQCLQPPKFAAPKRFDVFVARNIAIGDEGYRPNLQAAGLSLPANFYAIPRQGRLLDNNTPVVCPCSGHAFMHFIAQAYQTA